VASEISKHTLSEVPISRKREEAIELTEKQIGLLTEEIADYENKSRTARPQARPFYVNSLADAKVRLGSLKILLRDLKRPPEPKRSPASNRPPELRNSAAELVSSEPLITTRRFNSKPFRADLLEANRLGHSILVNQDRFFPLFFGDLDMAGSSVEIVCPFVKTYRTDVLDQLEMLRGLCIQCLIYTRPPNSSDAKTFLEDAKSRGITVIFGEHIHNKVAIIDNQIVWEGSLNILSHIRSEDSMRRLVGRAFCDEQRELLKLPALDLSKPCCSFKGY
jgi:hypothetical protein